MAFVTDRDSGYDTTPDRDEVSRVRPHVAPREAEISDADREALLLMTKLAERAAVARSFAKIAAVMLQASAMNAAARAVRVARAAADAAVHVAATEVERITHEAAKAHAPSKTER
jgi:hypothetical protein